MVFVGFEDRSKAVSWDKASRKIKVSRNVVFNENEELTNLREVGRIPRPSAPTILLATTMDLDDFACS